MSRYLLPDGTTPVLLSADTREALRRESVALLDYLAQRPEVTPAQVAATLFRTRTARRFRALAMVRDRTELDAALTSIAEDSPNPKVVTSIGPATKRKRAYVFPGQGSQYPGMGRMFYSESPVFRKAVDEAEEHFARLFGISPLAYLLHDSEKDGERPDAVEIVQPALLMQMVGLAAMWRAAGIEPAATVGHSQGEIAAVYVSGASTLADAIRVVTIRANAVAALSLSGYSMAVLGIDRDECEALIARQTGWTELSVVNSAHLLCISGDRDTVLQIVELVNARGRFAKEIRVQYPAHTSMVNQFRDQFTSVAEDLDNKEFAVPEIDCLGATLGGAITSEFPVADYWFWNLRNRVRFDLAVAGAADRGIDTYIEIAEHPTLMLAVQETLSSAPDRDYQVIGTSRRTETDLREFTRNVATVAVADLDYSWDSLREDSDANTAAVPPLRDFPHTQMNSRHLWAPYAPPARVVSVSAQAAMTPPARLVEEWPRLARRKLVAPRTIRLVDPAGSSSALAGAIAQRASRHDATVHLDGEAGERSADTVVIFVPPTAESDYASAVSEFADVVGSRDWAAVLGDDVDEWWVVTSGGEAVVEGEVPGSVHSAVTAGFRCIALEHIGRTLRHLDLPADLSTVDDVTLADRILDAVHTANEPELALRDGKLHAKRLVATDAAPAAEPRDLRNVLVLGGTGHVGLEFCEQFVRDGAGRITLVSRTGETAATAQRLREIRALGSTEVVVVACDVSDASAVADLAAGFAGNPASVLVHAAVNYTYSVSSDVDAHSAAAAAASKIIGLENVLNAVPLTDECRLLLCSSFAATLGGWGQTLYAGTNRILDAIAHRLRAQGRDCTSVQWGLWVLPPQADDSVHARVKGSGLVAMHPAAAIAAGFDHTDTNSIVLSAEWPRLRSIADAIGLEPVFAQGLATVEEAVVDIPAVTESVPEPEPRAPIAAASASPAVTPEAAVASFAERVRRELDRVMGADGSDSVDGSTPLVALGLDSLQALDLRKRIKVELNRELPVTAIMGGASLDDVVALMSDGGVHS
ncbi:nocobactin polyketide synthase NbtC [Antrihabitans sp. NCIMB 15449]|uniref:Nocobactin polyketide synthase NbtC n=1 Tax=Antrihabitans spumae TaxID=3373370 RepID=A0ABW7JID0_9NOCA